MLLKESARKKKENIQRGVRNPTTASLLLTREENIQQTSLKRPSRRIYNFRFLWSRLCSVGRTCDYRNYFWNSKFYTPRQIVWKVVQPSRLPEVVWAAMFGCFVVGFCELSSRISECGNGAELEYVSLPSKLALWEGNRDSSLNNLTFFFQAPAILAIGSVFKPVIPRTSNEAKQWFMNPGFQLWGLGMTLEQKNQTSSLSAKKGKRLLLSRSWM